MKGLDLGNKNIFILQFLCLFDTTPNGCVILYRLCVAGCYAAKGGRNRPYIFNWFSSHFGTIWAPQNGPKNVPKGPQVSWTYGPMSERKNKPLTKLLGPFLLEKLSETTSYQVFMLFFSFLGHLGTLKWTQKGTQMPAIGLEVWPNV
jgi:hypothetical protein